MLSSKKIIKIPVHNFVLIMEIMIIDIKTHLTNVPLCYFMRHKAWNSISIYQLSLLKSFCQYQIKFLLLMDFWNEIFYVIKSINVESGVKRTKTLEKIS